MDLACLQDAARESVQALRDSGKALTARATLTRQPPEDDSRAVFGGRHSTGSDSVF